LDYKFMGLHTMYMGSVWGDLQHAHQKKTVVYIGNTKFKGIVPYLIKKKNLRVSGEINIIYIEQEYFEVFKHNKITREKAYSSKIKNTDFFKKKEEKEVKYIMYDQLKIILSEIVYLIDNHGLPVMFEKDIDKVEMKALGDKQEEIINASHLTEGEIAKLNDKVRVMKHHSIAYGGQTYADAGEYDGATQLIVYRLSDDHAISILKRNYQSVPLGVVIIGAGQDGYDRFIKRPNAVSFSEACYEIKYGDFSMTKFGRILFSDSRTMVNHFKLQDSFMNIRIDRHKLKITVENKIERIINKRSKVAKEDKNSYLIPSSLGVKAVEKAFNISQNGATGAQK